MRRSILAVALSATALLAAACSGDSRQLPTTPASIGGRSNLSTPSTVCNTADRDALRRGVTGSGPFSNAVRTQARQLQDALEAQCGTAGTPAGRIGAALNFLLRIAGSPQANLQTVAGTTQGWWYAGQMGTDRAAVWQYMTVILRYAGFSIDNTQAALGTDGRVAVCDNLSDCSVRPQDLNAGTYIYAGALPARTGGDSRYLISLAPVSCSELAQSTNLKVWPQCVRISAAPSELTDLKFVAGSQGARVEVCPAASVQNNADVQYLVTPPAANAQEPGRLGQKPSTPLAVRPNARGNLGLLCGAKVIEVAARAGTGFGERATYLASSLLSTAGREVFDFLAPRALGASHGGLGSMGGEEIDGYSVFGIVDPYVFQGTFDNDTPGFAPAVPFRNRGTWTVQTLTPGDIVVRAPQGPFTTNFVILDQRGGNSDPKAGIALLANFAAYGDPPRLAKEGTYQVSWKSLIASPRAGGMAFEVRNESDSVLARVVFRDDGSGQAGPIDFNGQLAVGRWQQNVLQSFVLTIDLSTATVGNRVRFSIGGTAAGTPTNFFSPTLAAQAATTVTMTRAGLVADGVDARRLWADDIITTRLPDPSTVVAPPVAP